MINTVLGCYWLNCINNVDNEWEFKREYLIWTSVLLFIPISIALFLVIVVVKIVCFYLVDVNHKKKRKARSNF
jgi:hypothetical protein